VRIVEVGPRDGLQNAPGILPVAARAEFLRRVATTGVDRIEAVSFVHPQRVPHMAGAEDVVAAAQTPENVSLCGLVLNERGFDRLLAAGMTDARFTFAVSDAFNRANANASTEEGLATALRLLERARAADVHLGVSLATAFGCPFSGEVPESIPLRLAERLAEAGAREIVFADTIGVGVPSQVRELLRGSAGLGVELGVHLHNTRNSGYANAWTAVEEGAEILDAAVGGLGGCPFAPGSSGNIATEDLVYLLQREGLVADVDLDALNATALWLRDVSGFELAGHVHRVSRFPAPAVTA
jgi:hydroxymethylglutaryl-CoA lyase/(R)-citramalyl-CoA lyase